MEEKYIIFLLNNKRYCVNLSKINGIESDYGIVGIPTSAQFIKGIIHLRNEIVPVFNLKERFELDESEKGPNVQLLIAETHGIKLGLEVDDVLGIVPVEPDDIKRVPGVVKNENTGYLESVVKVSLPGDKKSDIILCISVDKLIDDEVFEELAELLEENPGDQDGETGEIEEI